MISQWAEQEAASVDLGDERLDARMALLLSSLGSHPNLSIPAACGGHGEIQAAYRFFDNEKVDFDKVLAPHCERTRERIGGHKVVLFVQDTTEVELIRPEQEVVGAGLLDGSRRGIFLHDLHAFTPDGTPLGTVWAQCLNRTQEKPEETQAQRRQRLKQTPLEEKESMRWLEGLRQTREVAKNLPHVQCICVGDSEADIYELFAEPRGQADQPRVEWLVRSCHDRAIKSKKDGGHGHVRQQVLSTPALYTVPILIRGREAKTTVEERARRQARQTRQTQVEVRAATVTLRSPWRAECKLPAVTVNVVLVSECNPPEDEHAVEWILITTLPIDGLDAVRRIVEYYCARWSIEILFRTLKSGCRIEQRRFEHIDRMLPCLATYLIVAWRVLFVCHMGRECPDADCEIIFEPSEWKSVWAAVHQKKPPRKTPRLSEVVHLIARLGGYVERPKSEPGPQTMWIGIQRMRDLSWAWKTFGPKTKIREA